MNVWVVFKQFFDELDGGCGVTELEGEEEGRHSGLLLYFIDELVAIEGEVASGPHEMTVLDGCYIDWMDLMKLLMSSAVTGWRLYDGLFIYTQYSESDR